MHTSCGSSSDLGNLAADSSGALASKSQLSSPKVIQCLNAFKPARWQLPQQHQANALVAFMMEIWTTFVTNAH